MNLDLLANPIYEVVPMGSLQAALPSLPAGSAVSVTCSPVKGIDATLTLCEQLAGSGHAVIPHLAARMVESEAHVDTIIERLSAINVHRAFVIAGDAETPHGPFFDSIELLRVLARSGHFDHLGFAAYPDGHAIIEQAAIDRALLTKIELLHEHGISASMSTQMCFDPQRIERWLEGVRALGVTGPVHLGVAGAVERSKLISMGMRLGVGTSLRYLRKNRSGLGSLLGSKTYDPSQLIEPLTERAVALGITSLHLFTFNQIEATAAWHRAALANLAAHA